MYELSTECLFVAISSVLGERERLIRKLGEISAEEDEEERLSERVMDMDRVIGELAAAYEAQRVQDPAYPAFEVLYASFFGNASANGS